MSVTKDKFDDLLTDKDFFELDARLSKFNIFSAVGAERAELRHSNFLATLLDPRGNHGLGEIFLTNFLIRATKKVGASFSPADVVLNDWFGIEVRREWKNIDILLLDRKSGFVCCIENKIDAGEHGRQLAKYAGIVTREFSSHEFPHRLFLFLTPDGYEPAEDDAHDFLPIGYDIVLASAMAVHSDLDPQSGMGYVLRQYIDLIEGKIMQDTELEDLCRRIYQRHREVLDKIIEIGKPDFIREISEFVQKSISEGNGSLGLTTTVARKNWIKIEDTTLDDCDWMKTADESMSESRRIVYFEFHTKYSTTDSPFVLSLTLGPGDEDVRQKVRNQCNTSPFNMRRTSKWLRLWQEEFVSMDDLKLLREKEKSMEDIQAKIRKKWENFKIKQLPELRDGLRQVA